MQDVDAYLLESIVQVRDKGKWVADVDILKAVKPQGNLSRVGRLALTCVAAHKGHSIYILPSSFCWKCACSGASHLKQHDDEALHAKHDGEYTPPQDCVVMVL
ncbi:hypothetical protein CIHG_06295 [Coccidioides immitis H538.4]|uniref:Uncharacterized protein n=3 Tax=Coccidioides immitis TaxID=5501 RepID=A0A0J8QRL0_COCIT|nr:hypothetical protein CIRG_09576 [Coccidioides immitis RMSCC 2394]KMU75339.1 hypothetical protein CISG_04758 [Coccidioides immitis RMSCC 3703]KMU88495.1 hypothetical protein CIHG_06295 [Coccidioides immitis H538.4]